MERADLLAALRQLTAAAEILAKSGPDSMRADAIELLAFFCKLDGSDIATGENIATSDDGLFAQTARAALTMVGRNEFAASRALLEQARSLLHAR